MPSVSLTLAAGGVCAPEGFMAAGVSAGLKHSGALDLALIASQRECAAAALFTTNRVSAAPVVVSRKHIRDGSARAVVVNAGCANACTGTLGLQHARAMTAEAGRALGVPAKQVLVCSTGLIGSYLPIDRVLAGIARAAEGLGPVPGGRGGEAGATDAAREGAGSAAAAAAAEAIMTTDTVPKLAAVIHRDGWSVGGIAKGAGMIAPNLATMLAFVTTDASVEAASLQSTLARAADATFNRISIDGDTSTNDTLILLANGASGLTPDSGALQAAVDSVCRSLSRQIVADGEEATKLVRVRVEGAPGMADALLAARAIATSLLVKSALYGGDANWGRVAAAAGYSGAGGAFDRLSISMAGVDVLSRGIPAGPEAIREARTALQADEIEIVCNLEAGVASAQMLTTDLSPEYVRFNGQYEL